MLLLILCLANGTIALATPDNLSTNIKQELEKIRDKEISVEKMDNQIQKVMTEISLQERKIKKIKIKIINSEEKILKVEKETDAMQKIVDQRLSAMYKHMSTSKLSYIDFLLNSKSFSDLISNVHTVKKIIDFDSSIIEKFNNQKKTLENEKVLLAEEKMELNTVQNLNKKNLNELEKNKESINVVLAQLKEQLEKLQMQQLLNDSLNVNNKDIEKQLLKINERKKNKKSYSIDRNIVTGDDFVDYAANFLGINYLWGGTTPSGFDCSGLVQYVYKHFNVYIPRTTYEQIKCGKSIPRDQLQPGDLVFFGTKEDVHHVGMYIGENMFIHAPRTGDVIRISLLNRSDYYGARRY